MFRLVKKIVILILMTFCSGNIKNITGNFLLIPKDNFLSKPNCFLLKKTRM